VRAQFRDPRDGRDSRDKNRPGSLSLSSLKSLWSLFLPLETPMKNLAISLCLALLALPALAQEEGVGLRLLLVAAPEPAVELHVAA